MLPDGASAAFERGLGFLPGLFLSYLTLSIRFTNKETAVTVNRSKQQPNYGGS